jgi:hypothetical protein
MTHSGSVEVMPDDADAGAGDADQSILATAPVAQAGLGLVAAAFGVIALVDATGLEMFGAKGVPGPGFFPVSLSIAVIALGALQVAASTARGVRRGFGVRAQLTGVRGDVLRAAHVWVGFLIGILLMPLFGFVPAAMLLLAYLVIAVERVKGIAAVLVVVAVPLAAYALFVFVLGVDLPESILFETP